MKPAIVEICYKCKDYRFRCCNCDSLNIDGLDALTSEYVECPDCGEKQTIPVITEDESECSAGRQEL